MKQKSTGTSQHEKIKKKFSQRQLPSSEELRIELKGEIVKLIENCTKYSEQNKEFNENFI